MASTGRTSILAGRYTRSRVFYAALVLLLIGLGAWVVWAAGGTQTALPHVMYFPVVLSALVFGARGALLAGVCSGLTIGPWMPLNVASGMPQPTLGWLVRLGFLTAVGLLVAEGRRHLLGLVANRQAFVSAISHEVRTPLAGIMGFAQMLAERYDEIPDSERREFAGLVHEQVTELSDIIDGYIVAARLDDSALVIDSRYVDLRVLIREVVGRLRLPSDVALEDTLEAADCWADPLRVRQILRSVLANVIATGGHHIRILLGRVEHAVTVTIVASGVSLDLDIGSHALASGHPSALSTGTRTRPVGMGLVVPARLAEMMGGRMTCEIDGTEVRFAVTLPRGPVRAA